MTDLTKYLEVLDAVRIVARQRSSKNSYPYQVFDCFSPVRAIVIRLNDQFIMVTPHEVSKNHHYNGSLRALIEDKFQDLDEKYKRVRRGF